MLPCLRHVPKPPGTTKLYRFIFDEKKTVDSVLRVVDKEICKGVAYFNVAFIFFIFFI